MSGEPAAICVVATQAGESSVRLNLVAAWREATVFTEAECAALELAERGTRIADGGGVHPLGVRTVSFRMGPGSARLSSRAGRAFSGSPPSAQEQEPGTHGDDQQRMGGSPLLQCAEDPLFLDAIVALDDRDHVWVGTGCAPVHRAGRVGVGATVGEVGVDAVSPTSPPTPDSPGRVPDGLYTEAE